MRTLPPGTYALADRLGWEPAASIDEPIEIRATDAFGNPHVLSAWLDTATGTIGYTFGPASGGIDESLSNIQAKIPYPRKAVPGWQTELLAFAASGTYTVTEVR